MFRSKSKNIILTAAMALSFMGCWKPDKLSDDRKADQSAATFRVKSGAVSGTADPVFEGDAWGKPFSVTLSFKACLEDRATDKALLGQTFKIVDPETGAEVDNVATQSEGCVFWTEPLPFNYFVKRSRWVTVERDIVGTGSMSGSRRMIFGVNPWLISDRVEIKSGKAGYFLRDDPMDVKDINVRFKKVYEFFSQQIGAEVQASGTGPGSALDQLKAIFNYGSETDADRLLAPPALTNTVLGGTPAGMSDVQASSTREWGNSRIWIDNVRPMSLKKRNVVVDKEDGTKRNAYLVQQTIQMTPRLMVLKANGAVDFEDIKQGEFDVYVRVVATGAGFENQDQSMILSQNAKALANAGGDVLGSGPRGPGTIVDGKLYANVSFVIDSVIAEGNVDFVVRLVPRGIGNRTPRVFEGIFNMGKVNAWIGAMPATMIDPSCLVKRANGEMACDMESYFAKVKDSKELEDKGDAHPMDNYLFTNVRPRFVQVLTGEVKAAPGETGAIEVNVGETATRRTVFYAASTCVNAASLEKIPGQKFILRIKSREPGPKDDETYIVREKVIETYADPNSCLNWTNTITHYYYRPEQFFQQELTIEGPGGYTRKKLVYLNPWDDKFTFGFDEEELGKEFFERIAKRPKIPSRFYTGDYSYHTVRFLYEIDPYMDLEVKKTVLMDLQPRVLRYSGILSGRKVTESLRDGIYLLKVGIQKSYLDPSDRFRKLCDVDRARADRDEEGRVKEVWERATVDDPTICALSRAERKISLADQAEQESDPNARLAKAQNNVVTKEFITAKAILVRVTDGLIIHPVELSMKDLRLMRIRSNFLVQLETVDESKVVLSDQIARAMHDKVQKELQDRRLAIEAIRSRTNEMESEEITDAERADIDNLMLERARTTRDNLSLLYKRELERINQNSNIISDFSLGTPAIQGLLDGFDAGKVIAELQGKYPTLTADRIAQLQDRYEFYKKIAQNDFTQVGLPDCDRIDCEAFKDLESGLKTRTFVGPVIFLSNSYKDAVRATDNLDEARCHEEIPGVDYVPEQLDPAEKELLSYETSLLSRESEALLGLQANNAYRYNKYFNSLRQFCTRDVPSTVPGERSHVEFYPKQVDDLMKEAKIVDTEHANKMKALATPYNFASIYNLDFVSYGGERLKKLKDVVPDDCLKQDIEACMVETSERTITPDALTAMANKNLGERVNRTFHWFWEKMNTKPSYSNEDVRAAVFGDQFGNDNSAAVCGLLASAAGENALRLGLKLSENDVKQLENVTFSRCYSENKKGFQRDQKLRIYNTGEYVFKGGLQLNFNVTASFGVGRGSSTSAGMDFFDLGGVLLGIGGWFVGGPVGAIGGFEIGKALKDVMKPFDLKTGRSQSESSGTSISEGTYLVSQVAKFSIPLTEWEQCTVLRLRSEAVNSVTEYFRWAGRESSVEDYNVKKALMGDGTRLDAEGYSRLNSVFGRGFFVCTGERRRDQRDIEELYFYFTQHFTEGDMLDQADLYNHPWLLSLRGLRDFSAFVAMIRGQEVGDVHTFWDDITKAIAPGVFGDAQTHVSDKAGWAWDHMANTYKATLPSFPGLYTVLDQGEGMNFFTLDDRPFSTVDLDINAEVNRVAHSLSPSTHLPSSKSESPSSDDSYQPPSN